MKKLLYLTILTFVIACNANAQTGITKYMFYGHTNEMPSGYHIYNDILYFSAIDSHTKTPVLWAMDGTTAQKRTIKNNGGIFPNFTVIGGNGNFLVMLVNDNPGNPHAEGIFLYNLLDSTLYPKFLHTGLRYNGLVLKKNNKAYYLGKTATGQAVFRYNINTSTVDTFCYLPPDANMVYLTFFNNQYFLSLERADYVNSKFYCDIYTVNIANKTLSTPAITPQTNPYGPTRMVTLNNDLYFIGYTQQNGTELYKYSGNGPAVRQTDINTNINFNGGSSINQPYDLVAYNNSIYFSGTDGLINGSLYEYTPATTTTRLIYNNAGKYYPFYPRDFYVYNKRLYMAGQYSPSQVPNPCVYNGLDTLKQLDHLQVAPNSNSYAAKGYIAYKGDLYFSSCDTFNNVHLYRFNDSLLSTPPQNIPEYNTPISVTLYPNPVVQDATLKISLGQTQKFSVQLTDISGRIVYNEAQKTYTAGKHCITLPMQQFNSGIYSYSITADNGVKLYSARLLKQ